MGGRGRGAQKVPDPGFSHFVAPSLSVINDQSLKPFCLALRDWSLITGRGGATKWEGGAREVLPLRKGGGGKSFSHAQGGAQKVLGSFYAVA